MKKKSTKPTPSNDPERQTRVLLEEVRADFKTVAEQYGSIAKKLDGHDQRLVKIEEKLGQHDLQFLKIDHRFDNLEKRFDRLDQQFGAIITDHEHRLKTIEQKLEIA